MLYCNVETKTGLVNGAISTVLSIMVNHMTVQFNHISEPVSTNPSVCCDYSQMPGFVVRLCHCRPL